MSWETLFELKAVSFAYPETTALDSVSLRIMQGERVAVLGANGSGKSTLLRILGGLCFPSGGDAVFCGTTLTGENLSEGGFARDFRRRVGIVFQNPDVQLFNPTVFDEVAFGPLQLGWAKKEIIGRVGAMLDEMEIAHLKHRAPHHLSGGEKKRVALASVLVLDPEVLLMDEPTAALDPKSSGHMVDFLLSCAGKKTVITTTHSLDIIEEIADRCVILQNGRVAGEGLPGVLLGDIPLLERTQLIHAHRHRHTSGVVHSHPHTHRAHDHHHTHDD